MIDSYYCIQPVVAGTLSFHRLCLLTDTGISWLVDWPLSSCLSAIPPSSSGSVFAYLLRNPAVRVYHNKHRLPSTPNTNYSPMGDNGGLKAPEQLLEHVRGRRRTWVNRRPGLKGVGLGRGLCRGVGLRTSLLPSPSYDPPGGIPCKTTIANLIPSRRQQLPHLF